MLFYQYYYYFNFSFLTLFTILFLILRYFKQYLLSKTEKMNDLHFYFTQQQERDTVFILL